jgi:hypothetical protein
MAKGVKNTYKLTTQGSLGLLALGHEGIRLWRGLIQEENRLKKDSVQKKNAKEKK